MKAVYCKTNAEATVIDIEDELEILQKAVGGDIELLYPSENDDIMMIVAEEGKINGSLLNRAAYDDHGNIIDVIAGDFLIISASSDNGEMQGISDEMAEKYLEKYRYPDFFFRNDGLI